MENFDTKLIKARDIPEAWFLYLREVLSFGFEYLIDRGSFIGTKRKELDLAVVQIKFPGSRPLVPDTPIGIPSPTSQNYIDQYLSYLVTDTKEKRSFILMEKI